MKPLSENEVAEVIVDMALDIHRRLGPGLLESVYQNVLAQVLTHLKLMDKKLGLLLNFGAALMKDGTHRVVNGL